MLVHHHFATVLGVQMQIIIDLMFTKTFVYLRSFFINLTIIYILMIHRACMTNVAHFVFGMHVLSLTYPLLSPADVVNTCISFHLILIRMITYKGLVLKLF